MRELRFAVCFLWFLIPAEEYSTFTPHKLCIGFNVLCAFPRKNHVPLAFTSSNIQNRHTFHIMTLINWLNIQSEQYAPLPLCKKGFLFWKWGSPIRKIHRVAYVASVTYSHTPAATCCGGSTVHSSTVISTLTYILPPTGSEGLSAHPV